MKLQQHLSQERHQLIRDKGVILYRGRNEAFCLILTIPHLILSEDDKGKFVTVNTAKFDIDSTFKESEYKIYYTDGLPDALADLLLFLLEEQFVTVEEINDGLK